MGVGVLVGLSGSWEYSPGFNAVCFFALLPPVVSAGVGRSSTGGSFRYEWRSSWPPRITRATAGAAAAWDYLGRPLATLPLAGRQSFGPRRHLLDRDAPKFALPGACVLDALQADGERIRIPPNLASASYLVQSRYLRSVTFAGRRFRFELLADGLEVRPAQTFESRSRLEFSVAPDSRRRSVGLLCIVY